MPRIDQRSLNQMRPISFETGYIAHHPGSVLVSFGLTKVLVTCTVEERVPHFRMESGGGWLTASYAMLPAATHQRKHREIYKGKQDGRGMEIQRLIGRSLRQMIDLKKIGRRTLHVDCDVIQADGGTRTASITGAYVAIMLCVRDLVKKPKIKLHCRKVEEIITAQVAAVSLGILKDEVYTDLCYTEDSGCDVDLNLVARADGKIIEIQGTAEGEAMEFEKLQVLIKQGLLNIEEIIAAQNKALS